jgi:hypothetical protein
MSYPAVSAAVYGVCSLYFFETIEAEKKKKPWDPWAILDNNNFDPWKNLNDPIKW